MGIDQLFGRRVYFAFGLCPNRKSAVDFGGGRGVKLGAFAGAVGPAIGVFQSRRFAGGYRGATGQCVRG